MTDMLGAIVECTDANDVINKLDCLNSNKRVKIMRIK